MTEPFMWIPRNNKILQRIQEEGQKINQLQQAPPPEPTTKIDWSRLEGSNQPIDWGRLDGTTQGIDWGRLGNQFTPAKKVPWYEKPQEYYSRPAAANIMLPIWAQMHPEDPGSQLYQEFLSEVENPLQYFKGFLPEGKARQAYNIAQMPRGSRAAVEMATELPIWMAIPGATGLRAGKLAQMAAGLPKGASAAEIAAGLAKPAIGKGAKVARGARALLKPVEFMEKAPIKLLQKLTKRQPITSLKVLGRIWDKSPAEDREALAKLAGLDVLPETKIPKVGKIIPKKVTPITPEVTRIGSKAWKTLGRENQKVIASVFKQPLELVALSADDPTIQPLIRKIISFMDEMRVAREKTDILTTMEKGTRIAKGKKAQARVLKAGGTEMEAISAKTAALKSPYPYEKFIAPDKIPTAKEINKLQEIARLLAKDDFDDITTVRVIAELFDSGIERPLANFELEALRRIFGADFVNAIKPLSRNRKIWNRFIEIANFPRALITSFDVSMVLRQNLFEVLAHPKQFPKMVGNYIKAIGSEEAAIRQRAQYLAFEGVPEINALMKSWNYGDNFAEYMPAMIGAKDVIPYLRSEEYMSLAAQRAWGLKQFGRGAVDAQTNAFCSALSEFWKLYKNVATKTDIVEMVTFAGNSIGRGSLGHLKFLSPILNATFFAPRYTFSLFRLPTFLFSPSPLVRREAMKRLVRFLMFGIYTLRMVQMAGSKVEVNPLSSDFGKIVIGKTRYDYWRGYAQLSRFMAQLIQAQRKSTSGKMYETTRKEVIERFFQSKSSPGFGLLYDLLQGKDYMGETIEMDTKTMKRQSYLRLTPLVVQDFVDALEEENLNMAMGAGIASAFGLGVQTYTNLGKYKLGGFGETGFGETGFGETGFGETSFK